MAVEVYHLEQATLDGKVLSGALLVTLYDPDTERAGGALSGHRLPEGIRGVLEFTGTRAGRNVAVRIANVAVTRSAGPGCEFRFAPADRQVVYAGGASAERSDLPDLPPEPFTIR